MDVTPGPGPGDDHLYVFMHLEKTGGTTINAHFSEHLGFDEEFAHLGPWGYQARAEAGLPQPDDWPRKRRNRLRVISGHRVHATAHRLVEGRTARYFTFFRNPADLAVSQYNHDASRMEDPPDFWDWFRSREPNTQLNWCFHRLGVVRYDEVIERLETFWFVGITEKLDRDLPHIFEAIGLPGTWENRRVAGGGADLEGVWPPIRDVAIERIVTVDDEIREQIARTDRKDLRLHRWARQRANDLRAEYGWD